MQLQLTTLIILFTLPLTIAAYPGDSTEHREAITHEYRSVDLDAFPELDARGKGAKNYFNHAKIKSKKYAGTCDPSLSKGYKSSHNCVTAGGKSYLCTEKASSTHMVTTCYTGGKVKSLSAENGECFS
ncbi:hypothetical protein G7Y89_g8199 [Cudoniella acicularis]|uniref:Uncharacterized protein n=1 Tax=Cudoniella acicularis TaxID=354080 RepID=A0A8H4RJB4_9HELO|nr:hypothetical protein G7Y89_g8199 [Cudoniella acicularis]